jgi:hypothetical protein
MEKMIICTVNSLNIAKRWYGKFVVFFRNSEVVDKPADEDDNADGSSGGNKGNRVGRFSEMGQANEGSSQSQSEK